tara:strand:+ start:211 stop:492 length:282 start_codon:yes stop_codon:yes gene_type:complete
MIELLKYLANNLEPEQLLKVAHIVSKNPQMIDQETFMEIVNAVEGFELREISEDEHNKLSEFMKHQDKIEKIEKIKHNSNLYKLLKDNNIGLN